MPQYRVKGVRCQPPPNNPPSSVSVILNKYTITKPSNHRLRVVEVRATARKLCQRLSNPSRFAYYCKLAWKLPQNKIWLNLELAENGREPKKLFSYLCEMDLL